MERDEDFSSDDDSYQESVEEEEQQVLDDDGNVDYMARYRCPREPTAVDFGEIRNGLQIGRYIYNGQGFTNFLSQLRNAVRLGTIFKIRIGLVYVNHLRLQNGDFTKVQQLFHLIQELEVERAPPKPGPVSDLGLLQAMSVPSKPGLLSHLALQLGEVPDFIGATIEAARSLQSLQLEFLISQALLIGLRLRRHPSLSKVDIRFYGVSVRREDRLHLEPLWTTISNLPQLTEFALNHRFSEQGPPCCPFSPNAFKEILQHPSLNKLRLVDFLISKADCRAVRDSFVGPAGTAPALKHLILARCKFSKIENAHKALFEGLRCAPSLSHLELDRFPFPLLPQPEIYSMRNSNIVTLDLGYCHLTADALDAITSSFDEECSLKELKVRRVVWLDSSSGARADGDNKVAADTVKYLTKLIVRCPTVTAIDVRDCTYFYPNIAERDCPEVQAALRGMDVALHFNAAARRELEAANAASDKHRALDLLAGCSDELNSVYRAAKLVPVLFENEEQD